MSVDTTSEAIEESPRRGPWRWIRWVLLALAILVVVLVTLVVVLLLYFHIPSNAAGMAAKSICSASFVAGRGDDVDALMEADVLPASPVLKAISVSIDTNQHTVEAKFLGMFSRQASLINKRGCVLDEPPDPNSVPYQPAVENPDPWPAGDQPAAKSQWPKGVDAAKLQQVVEGAFVGSGDPLALNARGVAVVQDGKLLAVRDGKGFVPNTALHGWSMTKTVAAMLFYKKAEEVGLDIETPVVDAFPPGHEPDWVAQWRQDERKDITVADLLFMRDGLGLDESYQPWGSVVQMLYGEPNMAGWAAEQPADETPGTYWEYLSATSNILAQVSQGQFASDEQYWDFSKGSLFDEIGVRTATLETDTYGTWVGSSYLWASVGDWARLGQLMLDDGKWGGKQVLPPGFLKLASTPAMPDGPGHGYAAQAWLLGDPVGGECKSYPGVPADLVAMEGHWGQIVAAVPSYDAVIVRLGWTFSSGIWNQCQFISDVLSTLPKRG